MVQSVSHSLGKVPSVIQVSPLYAAADIASAATGIVVGESAASAATSEVFYVVANKAEVGFKAFLML